MSTTTGVLSDQFDYDAFGWPYFYNASGGKGAGRTRFLFTGREWISDMRLYDYRARMYQPELGRFLQPDPKQFDAGDYNLYRYCHNDPVNKIDPLGLLTLKFDPAYPEPDRDAVRAAFTLGITTARGAELNADQRTLFIAPTGFHRETGRSGNTVYLNPKDRIFLDQESRTLYEKKYRNELPPQDARGRAIILFHEIGHIVTGEADEHEGGRNVRMNENPVRRGLVPIVVYRRQYAGYPIRGPLEVSPEPSKRIPIDSHIPR